MNKKSLNQLFTAYIDKFQFLNEPPQDEGYKWRSVSQFQKVFDLEVSDSDFASMLKEAKRVTYNLIDGKHRQPFAGLVRLAELEPQRVRSMFRSLLKDDSCNLSVRQAKIDTFLRECNALMRQYYPHSFLFVNDQRSAMAYLFFHDPDNHYLYKATEASYFSDCVGFYDEWGTMSSFKLDVYHRFCDELITEMKATPELLATNSCRFENTNELLHPDAALHILAFDVIYCAYTYHLYAGLSFEKVTPAERKLFQENRTKAEERLSAVRRAEEDMIAIQDAQRYFRGLITGNCPVTHKTFGELAVVELDEEYLRACIKKTGETKTFLLLSSIANGFLHLAADCFDEMVAQYKEVMVREKEIPKKLASAQKALEPYAKYLE